MPIKPSRRQVLRTLTHTGVASLAASAPAYFLTTPVVFSAGEKASGKSPDVILAKHPGARSYAAGYNGRFEQVPEARIMCRTTQHVVDALSYVRDQNLPFAIRSGGHCFAGLSQSGTVVIDVRGMDSVVVNKEDRTASIGAGATLGQVHRAVAKEGLLLSAGWCAEVGVSGQVLGGGIGFTSRFGGLMCDRLQKLSMVDAGGALIEARPGLNDDLLWASRGGGGSLGILTDVTVSLDEITQTTGFNLVRRYPAKEAAKIFARWQHLANDADRSITSHCSFYGYPNEQVILIFSGQALGGLTHLKAHLAELLGPEDAVQDHELTSGSLFGVMESRILKSMKGSLPLFAKSHFINSTMFHDACKAMFAELNKHPFGSVFVTFETLGGAVSDVGNTETAFPHRNAKFLVQSSVQPRHDDKKMSHLTALSAISSALDRLSTGGAYVNYRDRELINWAEAYWGENLPRLSAIKRKYDPGNVFRHAQSIPL